MSLKEKLALVQEQMGRPKLKLLQEVETRWNSTFHMLQRLVELREPVGAALASLQTDIPGVTSDEYNNVTACLSILSPFNEATVELSEEKRVSGSKVIPLLKMLEQMLQEEAKHATIPLARELGEHLIRLLREKLQNLQSMSIMSLATLLDPRFKQIGFFSPTKANDAVKRLTSECTIVIRSQSSPAAASTSSQDAVIERPGNYFCFGLRSIWINYDSHLHNLFMLLRKQTLALVRCHSEGDPEKPQCDC